MKKIIKIVIGICTLVGLFIGVTAFSTSVKADVAVYEVGSINGDFLYSVSFDEVLSLIEK